ncbi:MAG: hypothetical protein ACKV2Q_32925 [Planctomycetaceae bacterium]
MPTNTVVAITLGKRDLQGLIADAEGRVRRVSVRNVGAFHSDLLRQPQGVKLWLPADGRVIDEVKSDEADWLGWDQSPLMALKSRGAKCAKDSTDVAHSAAAPDSLRLADHRDLGETDGEVQLWLTPGILAESLMTLKREIELGEVTLKRIILLHTDREATSHWSKDEPRAAAPLLKSFLLTWLPGVSAEQIEIVPYLIGTEDKEVENSEGDLFLRPAAAQRIDDALKRAAEPDGRIRLHDSGGIPAAADVLRYSARFRFGAERVDYLPPSETKSRVDKLPGRVAMPIELLDARRRAVEWIRSGRFTAAAELAAGFIAKPTSAAGSWRRHLEAAAFYFRGYRKQADNLASKLGSESSTEALLRAIVEHRAQCLHVALLTEAALRSGDFLTAATQTVTFLDVALMDAVDFALRKNADVPGVDWEQSEIIPSRCRLDPTQLRQALADAESELTWFKLPQDFRTKQVRPDVTNWCADPSRFGVFWQKLGLARKIASDSGHALLGQGLLNLAEAIYRRVTPPWSPSELRNRIVHSLIGDTELNAVKNLFSTSQLWSRSPPPARRYHFLKGTLIEPVLFELGVHDASGLYDDLTESLVRDVEQAPLYDFELLVGSP